MTVPGFQQWGIKCVVPDRAAVLTECRPNFYVHREAQNFMGLASLRWSGTKGGMLVS